jgi:hypothetical protein
MMKTSLMILSTLLASVSAFSPNNVARHAVQTSTALPAASISAREQPFFFLEERETKSPLRLQAKQAVKIIDAQQPTVQHADAKTLKKSPVSPAHKEGPLSPIVLLAKQILGEDKLNKVRAKVISLHSDVIASFVDTAESEMGQRALRTLFQVTDKNHNGKIEAEELAAAFQALGFDWLKEKQVKGILERADVNGDGVIDFEEWIREAPKTLRTNLIKLAKKNGGELGLLA